MVWQVGTWLHVDVAAIRWCVEVWASSAMVPHPGSVVVLETQPMAARRTWIRCPGMPPGDGGLLPPATTRAAPLYRRGSSLAILCELIVLSLRIFLISSFIYEQLRPCRRSLEILQYKRVKNL